MRVFTENGLMVMAQAARAAQLATASVSTLVSCAILLAVLPRGSGGPRVARARRRSGV